MADLIVSPLVNLVKQQTIDCLKYQYELHSGVEGKLKKLASVLNRIEAVASTANELDLETDKNLKAWMMELKVAAEEASDVLDKFEYLCLERQAEGDGADDQLHFCPPSCACLKSFTRRRRGLLHSLKMYAKRFFRYSDPLESLRSVQITLDELASNNGQFLQVVTDAMAPNLGHDGPTREEGSTVKEPLVGRKHKLEKIINRLLLEEEPLPVSDGGSMGAFLPVLAIIGHGGMGKTTLAQHVYNDTRVKDHFKEVKMWAYVSQQFDVPTIMRRMIESAPPKMTCSGTESLEALQQKLKDIVKSKKFLLVLDDVWYANQMEEEWKKLCSPLVEAGGKGSKILLTSRTPEAEGLPGALTPSISLEGLKQDECWSIIQTNAFRGSEIREDLVQIGRQIAGRVCGSPLAAQAVGVILRKKMNSEYWLNILNSELSKLPDNNVMSVLSLSYKYLQPHLRQCFAYCSLFPKGYKFNINMLVRMWVAHGYIGDRLYGERTEEDTGRRYFHDLLSLGFFTRRIDDDGIEEVVMHDLMNDLAQFVSKDEFLLIEHTLPQDDDFIPETIQHLSVLSIDYLADLINKKSILGNLKTFLLVHGGPDLLYGEHVREVLKLLRRVRVLDIRWVLTDLPDDIHGWEHLRYLNLSSNNSLPEWLWRLYHLQVLKINTFPTDSSTEKLGNLVKLRSLSFDKNLTLAAIRGLKSLQTVDSFLLVESGRGSDIRNMKPLNEFQEGLFLGCLDYVESGAAAREADLCSKKHLQMLVLKWQSSRIRSTEPDVAAEVLNGLQPPSSLKKLEISHYPGIACPNWMGDPSFTSLHHISLEFLLQLERLPPLEQLPSLKTLKLLVLPSIKKLIHKVFPSLRNLTIMKMQELEEWSGTEDWSGGLPCLEFLTISDCPKLRKLPTLSPTVTYLDINDVGISSLPGIYDDKCVDQGMMIANSSNSGVKSSSSDLFKVTIARCGGLKSLGDGLLQNQHRLRHLKQVMLEFNWRSP